MANKYLDGAGLDHAWDKIKSYLTSNYAAKSHTHTIAQITNLQTTLNGKANSSHTHTTSQITDLNSNYSTKSELSNGLAGKANKATTLAGYGITDAYTKSQADSNFPKITITTSAALPSIAVGDILVASYPSSYNSRINAPSGGRYICFYMDDVGVSGGVNVPGGGRITSDDDLTDGLILIRVS